MKIQIDTDNKKITVEETVKLIDLFDFLDNLLPDSKWKEYSLESKVIVNWQNPIQYPVPCEQPNNPYNRPPTITYGPGIRNFEVILGDNPRDINGGINGNSESQQEYFGNK